VAITLLYQVLKYTRFSLLWAFRRLTLTFLKATFRISPIRSRVLLSYSQGDIPDGLGAQIQRVIAINALGAHLSINVKHPPITEVARHPIDHLSDAEYSKMLSNVNEMLSTISVDELQSFCPYFINDLRFKHFAYAIFKALLSKSIVNMQIRDSYYFVDAKPSLYKLGISRSTRIFLRDLASETFAGYIALHHRHGVGNMAIQPGQLKPRELDVSVYLAPLQEATKKNREASIVIFTDAPDSDMYFLPNSTQVQLWAGLPQFDGTKMKIAQGQFRVIEEEFPGKVRVIRGGNPLIALANLATSGQLILSRSSFGYLAALFADHSKVWIPGDFWHPKHKNWTQY